MDRRLVSVGGLGGAGVLGDGVGRNRASMDLFLP